MNSGSCSSQSSCSPPAPAAGRGRATSGAESSFPAAGSSRDWLPSLVAWYARCKRDLPWRGTGDPWLIWVSEVLLQQTRVDTVVSCYRRFTDRFPTVESLARASLQDVLRVWEGFGYYARARNLHAAARIVLDKFGGRVPADPEVLQTLPGVGPYIAAAVASIAWGVPVVAVDANVERVGARLFGIDGVRGTSRLRRQVSEAFQRGMEQGGCPPGELNQALMDLGATVCGPKVPECSRCPVAEWCAAMATGSPERFPRAAPRRRIPTYRIAVGVIRRPDGRILIARRPEEAMLGGLWEFPGGKCLPGESEAAAVQREIREETGLEVIAGPEIASVRHAYSHFRIILTAFWCHVPADAEPECRSADELRWVTVDELDRFPFPRANRRIIAALR